MLHKIVRYRVYGIIDTDTEGIEEVLESIRQYGSAACIDVEVIAGGRDNAMMPLAEDDFKAHYKEITPLSPAKEVKSDSKT